MESRKVGYVLILWTFKLRHASYQVHDTVLNEQLLAGQPSLSVDATWPLRPSRPTNEPAAVGYVIILWTVNLRQRLRDKDCKTRTYPGAGDPISGLEVLQGQLGSTLWEGIPAKSQSHQYCLMQHVI